MKTKIIQSGMAIAFMFLLSSCGDKGNTGNGAADTPIKHGSGYSDSANPERGEFDRAQTPNEQKRTEAQNK